MGNEVSNRENTEKSVAGVLIYDGQVLLARHTYGAGKSMLIIPGGFLKPGELPEQAVVREYMEKTGLVVRAGEIIGVRFNAQNWYVVYRVQYISGVQRSDGIENNGIVWVEAEEALERDDVPELTKSMIRCAYCSGSGLQRSEFHGKGTLYSSIGDYLF